jgi:hypothetical protein
LTRNEKTSGEVGRESLGFLDENRKKLRLIWTRVAGFGGRKKTNFHLKLDEMVGFGGQEQRYLG